LFLSNGKREEKNETSTLLITISQVGDGILLVYRRLNTKKKHNKKSKEKERRNWFHLS